MKAATEILLSAATPAGERDLAGKQFGGLCVIGLAEVRVVYRWRCRCECGQERIINEVQLRTHGTQSCGCHTRKATSGRRRTHGKSIGSKAYEVWLKMRQRCRNPKAKEYKYYGARGISICPRWDDFAIFLSDMGEPPHGTSLDRYPNNDGNYEPDNCRWATRIEQGRNKRNNHLITIVDETLCLTAWCARLGLNYDKVHKRITRYGWDAHRALEIGDRHGSA